MSGQGHPFLDVNQYYEEVSFYSVLHPFQDYFSSYEKDQSVGVGKTGEPREKTPGTHASRIWHVIHVPLVGLEPTPDTAVRQSNG